MGHPILAAGTEAGRARSEAFLERFARSHSTTGHVSLLRCQICGTVDWMCTDKQKSEFSYSVGNMPDGQCDHCGLIARRAPEIYNWVLNVLATQERQRGET